MRTLSALLFGVVMLTAGAQTANAHFVWLVFEPAERPTSVKLYFGETAAPDDPDLLDRVATATAVVVPGRRGEPKTLAFEKRYDALVADFPANARPAPVVLRQTYGVVSRGDGPFLLKYYAKAYPSALPGTWDTVADSDLLPLEIVPKLDGSSMIFEVLWKGRPASGATVTVHGPGLDAALEGMTDERGLFRAALPGAGLYSVRARRIEMTAGERGGKKYDSIRHYSTLSLNVRPPQLLPVAHNWPSLPRGVTSFGAAIAGDRLYVYGGHYGEAHHYSSEGQSGDFFSLDLRRPSQWEALPGGTKLTGLAMVEHDGKLYRVGGFTAKNGAADDQDLWSQPDFARFDPQAGSWEALPPMPEGRSSHDAAVIGDTLFVVGGWCLQGGEEAKWHDLALAVDLSEPTLAWKTVAAPPFRRRALALAAWNDRLFVLGGMQQEGAPTTRVAVYEPAADSWSEGPELLGTGMDGFGGSSFACGGRLFASTMSGSVQRLSSDGSRWEFAGQLAHPRFFHRMLPWEDKNLVFVGGASMKVGKIDRLECLSVVVEQAQAR